MTIKYTIIRHCSACNKQTKYNMIRCYIDMDIDKGNIARVDYGCETCARTCTYKYYQIQPFELQGEIK